MADFSSLGQQQAIAANIPYKNIALGNPAETFLNAWQMATNIRLKKSELEGKMAALAVKNRQLELDSQLDRAKFGLALQKADIDATHKGNMYELAAGRLQLEREDNNLSARKYNDAQEGKTGLIDAQATLADEGLYPGMPGYPERFNQLTAPFIGKVPNQILNQTQRAMYSTHNKAAGEKEKYYQHEVTNFSNQLGDTIWGNRLKNDPTPIIHPELLPQEETGGFWPFTSPTKTERRYVTDEAGNKRYFTMKELNDWKARYNDLENMRKGLAPQISRPDLGVNTSSDEDIKLNQARQARTAAAAKGADITPQLKVELQKLGIDPNKL